MTDCSTWRGGRQKRAGVSPSVVISLARRDGGVEINRDLWLRRGDFRRGGRHIRVDYILTSSSRVHGGVAKRHLKRTRHGHLKRVEITPDRQCSWVISPSLQCSPIKPP
ncbi:hypothetical protein J6590_044719 [Homalodisca vitripennis]|nr:hypothetical protein J6590_044719 [Homalodisca vitripennis]